MSKTCIVVTTAFLLHRILLTFYNLVYVELLNIRLQIILLVLPHIRYIIYIIYIYIYYYIVKLVTDTRSDIARNI